MTDEGSLLGGVQRDLLAGKPLPDLLRQCLILGSQSGSTQLRTWAGKELRGYEDADELPAYRKVHAQIHADGSAGRTWVTGQTVAWSALPQFVRDDLDELVPMFAGVGQLQSLYESAIASDSNPRLSLPGWQYIARAIDSASGNPVQHTHALYWSISSAVIAGILDDIRTTLAELLAELGAVMPPSQDVPTAEQATQALHIAVSGGQPNFHLATTIAAPRATGGSTISNISGGQAAAADGDVNQHVSGATTDGSATILQWLDDYRTALHELEAPVRPVAEQQIEQVAAEVAKPDPHPAVVSGILGSLKTFATNAVAAAGTGAGTMGLAQVIANWPL